MMSYTLGQAAKATGKSKPTILEQIKKGRISAAKNILGHYEIDPSELHRVYPPISQVEGKENVEPNKADPSLTAEKEAEISGLKARLEVMEQLVSELRGDKDKAERREADLRRDIDRWQALTFDAQQRLKALEAPKQEPMHEGRVIEADAREPTSKKGFFRRLFG